MLQKSHSRAAGPSDVKCFRFLALLAMLWALQHWVELASHDLLFQNSRSLCAGDADLVV